MEDLPMLNIPFAAGSAAVVVFWLFFRIAAYHRNRSINWKYEALQLFFLVNHLVIHRVTIHPFSKVDGKVAPLLFETATAWPFRVNLIPFVNLLDYDSKRDLLLNLIGNFALFLPPGIATPVIYKNINTLKKVTLTGFAISLTIEIIQLPFAVRASDVDDLILNTAGCLAGYGIYALVRAIRKKKTQNLTDSE